MASRFGSLYYFVRDYKVWILKRATAPAVALHKFKLI